MGTMAGAVAAWGGAMAGRLAGWLARPSEHGHGHGAARPFELGLGLPREPACRP